MRVLAALMAMLSVLALGGTAQASCVPTPLSQKIDGAYAIATGTVVAYENGDPRRLVFDVEAVHKGSLSSSRITVMAGPDVPGGPPGTQGATSVDYAATVGTRHTLYLHWDAPSYRTDACTASHEGPPTAEERAAFAAFASPPPGGTQSAPPPRLPATSTAAELTWFGFAMVGALGAALAARRVPVR